MKNLLTKVFCGIFLLMAACQGTTSNMEFKFKNKQAKFENVFAYLRLGSGGGHSLGIANYEMNPNEPFGMSRNEPKQEGQYSLDISLTVIDDKLVKEPFSAGEFTDDPNVSGNPRVIDFAILKYFADGKMSREDMRIDVDKKRSYVRFTEPKDDSVDVELNINDMDGRSMNGKFTAKIVKY